jgi:hypothetical protein
LDIFNRGLKRHRKGITIHPDNVKSGRERHVSIDRSAEISNTRARALICFGFTLFLIFSLWPTALFLSFPPSLTFFCLFCSAVLVSGVFACPLPFTTLNLRRRCKKLGSVWSRTKHRHTTEYNTESSVFFHHSCGVLFLSRQVWRHHSLVWQFMATNQLLHLLLAPTCLGLKSFVAAAAAVVIELFLTPCFYCQGLGWHM